MFQNIGSRLSAAIQVGIRCKICQKSKGKNHFVFQSDDSGNVCDDCYAWHRRAIRLLGGEIPKGCQECNRSVYEIAQASASEDVRFFVHPKDGIYQLLCARCSDAYERKVPIYKETLYGRMKKMAGCK